MAKRLSRQRRMYGKQGATLLRVLSKLHATDVVPQGRVRSQLSSFKLTSVREHAEVPNRITSRQLNLDRHETAEGKLTFANGERPAIRGPMKRVFQGVKASEPVDIEHTKTAQRSQSYQPAKALDRANSSAQVIKTSRWEKKWGVKRNS